MTRYQVIATSVLLLTAPHRVLAGAIDEAKPITEVLTQMLNFLLLIFGVIAILGMIVAGFLYFSALGDERRVRTAKKAFFAGVAGIVIVAGSMVLVWTVSRLLG